MESKEVIDLTKETPATSVPRDPIEAEISIGRHVDDMLRQMRAWLIRWGRPQLRITLPPARVRSAPPPPTQQQQQRRVVPWIVLDDGGDSDVEIIEAPPARQRRRRDPERDDDVVEIVQAPPEHLKDKVRAAAAAAAAATGAAGAQVKRKEDAASVAVCPICLSEPASTPLARTPCHHTFCADCLDTWLSRYCKACPLCKAPLTKERVEIL